MKYLRLYEKFPYGNGEFYYIPYSTENLILLVIDKMDIDEEYKELVKNSNQLFQNFEDND